MSIEMQPAEVIPAFDEFLAARGLVALIDRGTDFDDCVALEPTAEDLVAAWPFVAEYQGNPESRVQYWIPLARMQMERLAKRLGYDVVL